MSEKLTLYSHPMSRGRIARWMLEETGVEYGVVMLDMGTTMKAASYLEINPMGKVPVLMHGSQVVTECAAICAYLADAFPAARLAPPLAERADYYRWLFFGAGPVEQAVTARALGVEVPENKRGMVGFGSLEQVLDTLEQACTRHDYLAGNTFTAADVYTGSQIGWGMQFGTIDRRPAFVDYWERISSRVGYRSARALDDAAVADKI